MRRAALLLPLLIAVACGPAAERVARPVPLPTGPAKTAFPQPRADGRLPSLASPLRYALALDVDPNQPRFAGHVAIDIVLSAPSTYVVLHGRTLDVTKATATFLGSTLSAKVTARPTIGIHKSEELVLEFPEMLPAGSARLELAWTAPFDDELSGLYRVREDGLWYAFTQFEPTDARRAFPCFDEPGFKVPFEVSVNVPKGMIAIANSPERSHTETAFRFEQTPPLPTYLLAIAVGAFEIREAANRTRKPAIRIVTTKGKSHFGELALEANSALVDLLADWFGIPYPFQKLDVVAVPEFAAGAMENAGLVTYRSELLLLDPTRASIRARRSQALTVAHELAHQWFGNLVTAAWWNDIWLNEGMATWMEYRIVQKWQPTWGTRDDAALNDLLVMDEDSLSTARAVRQPVTSTSEIEAAFDPITYEKGAAILSTVEKWVGEQPFRAGVRAYLTDNANRNATTDRLFAALDRTTGKAVTAMAKEFLDRPGVPVVIAVRTCEPGGRWNVELSQEQWRPLGSTIEVDPNRSWILPVCVKAQGEKKDACVELAQGAPSLAAGRGCPAWFLPNSSGSYFRFDVDEKDVLALGAARPQLDVPQRLAVLLNAWASVRAGKLSPVGLLKLLPFFDDDPSRHVASSVIGILHDLNETFVDESTRPAFAALVRDRLAKKKQALGWSGKRNETGDETILRRSVLATLASLGEDDDTIAESEALAKMWFTDPSSVNGDLAGMAVYAASQRAGGERLAQLEAIVKSPKTDEDRLIALRAMVGFDDPKLLDAALRIVLTDAVRVSDVRTVLGTAFGEKRTRAATETWVRAHWEELRKKLPGSLGRTIFSGAGNACSKSAIAERAAWYGARTAAIPGAERELAQLIERDSLCAALRDAAGVAFAKAIRR